MASVLPKVKIYFFISMICLLLNMSVFFVSLIQNDVQANSFLGETHYEDTDQLYRNDTEENSLSRFAFSTGGSFIPFYGLVPFVFGSVDLPPEITVVTVIITGILGAFQIFLLSIIILNFVPKILGSGVDV